MNTDNHPRERIFTTEKDYQITTMVNEPPKIPMKLDLPITEAAIRKGKNDNQSSKKVSRRAISKSSK